jgi:hypothetical protein
VPQLQGVDRHARSISRRAANHLARTAND